MDSNYVVFRGDLPPSTISNKVARGELVRLAKGIYVAAGEDPVEVVQANWAKIVGRLFEGGVITDRSAPSAGPVNGVLYVAHDARSRDMALPGLFVRARQGAGPQPDDIPLPGGLYFATTARGLAENSLESRTTKAGGPRTLDDEELGDWIDRLCRRDGEVRLAEHRKRAEELAGVLGVPENRLARMQTLIGVALGTKDAETESESLAARRRGRPVDQARVALFENLVEALQASAPQSRPVGDIADDKFEPFVEAYFSNYIEGTEFEFDEAARIVFDGEVPAGRPKDAHDITGTYRLLTDRVGLAQVGESADDFLEILKRRHRSIMEGRPEKNPGEFKDRRNQAGATVFVDPDLVGGTLATGFRLREQLDTAWERAVYMAFVVAEVHPFADGNGRTARAMMAGELEAGGQKRIIVPTVYRSDYLDGLRRLSRQSDPSVFIKAMRYAHDFTASIDFRDYATMKAQLEEANAFEEPEGAKRLRVRGREQVVPPVAPWRAGA